MSQSENQPNDDRTYVEQFTPTDLMTVGGVVRYVEGLLRHKEASGRVPEARLSA